MTVGRANDRYFLLMAGVGLDAAVAGSVDPELKRRFGKAAFFVAAMQFIWRWELAPFVVHLDGEPPVEGRFVVAGNARSYGGGSSSRRTPPSPTLTWTSASSPQRRWETTCATSPPRWWGCTGTCPG
ncbi:MAG: hypothetical protein A6D92_06210 [Symbiobacterium thermophilum]|uniref:YegS/DAGK C-terminal domain-containing protein n=1 Tax=Symbiobacterium thermophilum TaxID=2734 RepID=A0A1Y2T701_SYMTR|nr:MAG: hypothetical protein A6D92_06210 [Symbiobacterium thermophilum]